MKKLVFGILFLLVLVGSISAAPAISSIGGNFSDGENITINGNFFGENGPNIAIFDNFELGSDDQRIRTGVGSSPIGFWSLLGGAGTQKYQNDYVVSGNLGFTARSGFACQDVAFTASMGDIYARTDFPNTKEFFGTWWVYIPTNQKWPGENYLGEITGLGTEGDYYYLEDSNANFEEWPTTSEFVSTYLRRFEIRKLSDNTRCNLTNVTSTRLYYQQIPGLPLPNFQIGDIYRVDSGQGGANWKQVWAHSGLAGASCRDSDVIVPVMLPHDGDAHSGGALGGNCAGEYGALYGHDSDKGIWKRTQIYWKGSAIGEGEVLSEYLQEGGTGLIIHDNRTSLVNMGNESHNYNRVHMGAYTHLTVGGCSNIYFDDFYLASGENCRARVEIGNQPDYYGCTNLAIITPIAWSSNQINATIRQGSFQFGEEVYLFVVDANGSISDGYGPITLSGEITQPELFCGDGFCNNGENCTICPQDCGNCTANYATPHIQDYITLQEMLGSVEDYKRGLTPIEQVVANIKKFIWG